MGGCCEPNKVLNFNNRTELITKYNREANQNNIPRREALLSPMSYDNEIPNNNNNAKRNYSSSVKYNEKEDNFIMNDNEIIPQLKDVKIPSMKIPLDIIQTKKQLELTIFESKFLPEGRTLTINPGGLIGSERNAQDGITIFGINNCEFVNDFNFPEEESTIGKRHFEIKYDISSDEYKIKNISGSGVYIKINKKKILKNDSIFSFDNTLISTKISFDSNANGPSNNNIISLKVIYGINQGKEVSFESKNKQIIRIGRLKSEEIDLDFNDDSISRFQTTIFYEGNNWYISDGDGKKPSLNGTWYFAEEYITITEGTIFRAGSTSFSSHLVTP